MNDLVVDRGPNPYLTNLIISCNGRKMTTVQGDGENNNNIIMTLYLCSNYTTNYTIH